jgi:hypothetical protein
MGMCLLQKAPTENNQDMELDEQSRLVAPTDAENNREQVAPSGGGTGASRLPCSPGSHMCTHGNGAVQQARLRGGGDSIGTSRKPSRIGVRVTGI